MKIKYDFYSKDCPVCEVEDTKLGSTTCQKCKHFRGMERDKWIECAVNAGKESVMNDEEMPRNVTKEMRKELRGDFPEEAYKVHDSKSFLTTLKAMYIVERLNDVFGIGRWTIDQQTVINDNGSYVLMSGRLTFLDYDCQIPTQYGGHATSGTNKEPADGYKSAVTDILSKSASYLEIGIDLFKGKINPSGGGQGQNKGVDNKNVIERQLTANEVKKLWNGKLYKGTVYINDQRIKPPDDQIEKLKAHKKFKES